LLSFVPLTFLFPSTPFPHLTPPLRPRHKILDPALLGTHSARLAYKLN
jgi:hypothetical protein